MPIYEYQCDGCGQRFDRLQTMSAPPLQSCPGCGAQVRRLIGSGAAILVRGGDPSRQGSHQDRCDRSTPCCGRPEPCDAPPCGER